MATRRKEPEILFWVGSAGSFDERAKKNYKRICTFHESSRIRFLEY